MNPVDACKSWVEQVVIGHNFCPFAKREYDLGKVRFVLSETTAFEAGLQTLIKECKKLDDNDDIETTLIIFSKQLASFDDFLDFVDMANQLMEMQGYEGVYQLANFHPDYCFEGEAEDDASNYTNRSPWPMLHLIREKSMEYALTRYPEPQIIPENNIKLAREKGSAYFQKLLNQMKKE
jgi:uncharacterized protein